MNYKIFDQELEDPDNKNRLVRYKCLIFSEDDLNNIKIDKNFNPNKNIDIHKKFTGAYVSYNKDGSNIIGSITLIKNIFERIINKTLVETQQGATQ